MSVHNLKREQIKSGDVYIGRGSLKTAITIDGADGYFGNPSPIGSYGYPPQYRSRNKAIAEFIVYATNRLKTDPEYRQRVKAIHGKRLFCYCAPLDCHGDVLERLAAELVAEDGAC